MDDLTEVLAGHTPGEWVVLDSSSTPARVAGSGATPQEAIAAANAARPAVGAPAKTVLMQVPDPNAVYVY